MRASGRGASGNGTAMANRHATCDVAVIGGGPAGATAALILAQTGYQVLLVEQQSCPAFKVGEALPPAARPLLRDLGLLDRLEAGGHLPSYGIQAAWGGPALQSTDFIRDPHGPGWHLDRAAFDAGLRAAAREAGAGVREGARAIAAARTGGGWHVTLAAPAGPPDIAARWLIDCSGRARWLARQLRVARHSDDRLLAFVTRFRPAPPGFARDHDARTLVEAGADGWWYTALLPDGERVVVYHTDARNATSAPARTATGYGDLLAVTTHMRALLTTYNYQLGHGPRPTAANSTRLAGFAGAGWIAAGDAAIAFDPLSSQGIFTALYAGLHAARALHAHLTGDAGALAAYDRNLTAIYAAYLHHRAVFYRLESRWAQQPFWHRRRQDPLERGIAPSHDAHPPIPARS